MYFVPSSGLSWRAGGWPQLAPPASEVRLTEDQLSSTVTFSSGPSSPEPVDDSPGMAQAG